MVVGARSSSVVSRRELFGSLSSGGDTGVTLLSAPPGSPGKTVLLRSWIEDTGLHERVAWVSVEGEEQDAQRFWGLVIGGLHEASGGLVERLEPTPTFDGEAVVERLISELGMSEQPVVLVLDAPHAR